MLSIARRRPCPPALSRILRSPVSSRPSSSSSPAYTLRYGFIGLGRMGLPMAKNLRANLPNPDSPLHVFDVSEAPVADLMAAAPNVHKHASVADVAQHADVVITMLPAPQHVKAVYAEIAAALASKPADPPRQKIFIDSSTIDVSTSIQTSNLLRGLPTAVDSSPHLFFDAPVSGGVVGATNATLTFMVGGVPQSLVKSSASSGPPAPADEPLAAAYASLVRPTLATMGKNLVPCGGPGLGLAAKLANNYLLALTNIATAESFQLARALGLDLALYSQIVASATGRSWSSDVNNPVPGILPNAPASREYTNGFGLSLMKKDLGLAIQAARDTNLPLLLADDAYRVYSQVEQDPDCANRDMSVIYKYIQDHQK